jgi:hypothetical protein
LRIYRGFILACGVVYGQNSTGDYLRQSLTGAFVYEVEAGPNSGLSSPLLNSAPGYSADYGFRARRWLMAEVGFGQIIRPIGRSVCCEYSTDANDQLYLVPFGARYVFEPRSSRVRFTLGGGGAYMNHSIGKNGEIIGFSGFGGQFVASGDYAVTRSGRLRVGLTARYYFAAPKSDETFGPGNFYPSDHVHIFVLGPSLTFSFH